jgi:hypothetical protein
MAATKADPYYAPISVGTSASTVELTAPVREIVVTNTHATARLSITLAEGTFAANPATAAVADALGTITVGPMSTKTIWRNPQAKKLINLSLISSSATTPAAVEGRVWLT